VTAVVQNGAAPPPPPPPPPPFTVSQSLSSSQNVSGTIAWSATPSGVATTDVSGVDFLVDSQKVTSDTVAPYGDAPGFFDTKSVADGSHVFSVKAAAKDGRTATASATVTVANGTTTPPPPNPTPQPSFPIYAAFTYPWYPETWTVDGAHVFYRPTLGYYSTNDVAVQQAQIREMDYAGLEASISSWWGPTHYTHTRLKTLMQTTLAMGSKLKWAVYYEMEGYDDPSVDKLAADLTVIRDSLATSPAYLKVNGRFVVFVYGANDTTCAVADRWKQANQRIANAAYVQLKVFYGWRNCASQPDAWHQYGPSTASDEQAGQSITISPGFWRANESSPRLARDPARWRANVAGMVASSAPWKLVATYNEWTEGTAIESAADWASASGHGTYVDALRTAIVGP
jgi:glycosyl hydrolase family 99